MRLLIITQKVDREDPVLGFFHGWLLKFSENFNHITVVCLQTGRFNLPSNVKVLSLGKENRKSKISYIFNFYKYIWQERKNYDAVFVHMNEEYVLLGWKLWFLFGKKIYLWRNHAKGSFLTRLAVLLSHRVFYTSPDSYTARFKKSVQMPVGIDTEQFKVESQKSKVENSILFLGRIAPVKNVDLFVDVMLKLGVKADVYGDALSRDAEYFRKIKEKAKDLITFFPGVPNYKTPEIYGEHEIYVNLTPLGSFDKTILEAAMCGCIPLSVNPVFNHIDERLVCSLDPANISSKLTALLNLTEEEREGVVAKLQTYVFQNHSLSALMDTLVKNIENNI